MASHAALSEPAAEPGQVASDSETGAALQHGHWRSFSALSSVLERVEHFLAGACFDRAPWLAAGFAGGIGSWFALASLQEKAGSLEASRRSTERGLAMEPERVEGWLRLARLGQLGGNDATTIAILRQAVARLDSEPRLWRALGQAGLRAGDGQAAYDGLSKAMALGDTEAPTLVRILADWHFRRGERDLERRARALLD